MENLEKYYTTDQVAAYLGVCEMTIRRWIQAGRLGAVDLGSEERAGPYRIPAEDLDAFLRSRHTRLNGRRSMHKMAQSRKEVIAYD